MADSLDQLAAFMGALREQESRNDYTAIGPQTHLGTAKGAYQFVDSTWGGYGGYANAAMAPAAVQDQRAAELMTEYFNRWHSWDLVAIAWHAGPGTAQRVATEGGSAGTSDGLISTDAYARQVRERMGSAEPVSSVNVSGQNVSVTSAPTTTGGSTVLSPTATEAEVIKFITDTYGTEWEPFLAIPDVRAVLLRAGREGASPALFQTYLRDTTWWKSHSGDARAYYGLRFTDPATLANKVTEKTAEVQQLVNRLGINLGGPEKVREWAENYLKYGWNDELLMERLGNFLQRQSNKTGFTEGSSPDITADKLMAIARTEYFTPVDRQTVERWAVRAVQNNEDVEAAWRDYLANMSSARFGIDPATGLTPADVMAPVRMAIAEQLEIAPEAVDFMSPKYREALQIETSDGRFRPMTAYEAQKWARSQEEFAFTKTATDETAAVGETLAKTFGMVG